MQVQAGILGLCTQITYNLVRIDGKRLVRVHLQRILCTMNLNLKSSITIFLSLLLTGLLSACATTAEPGSENEPQYDPQIAENPAQPEEQAEADSDALPAEPTDAEVMYNVFAAELLGSEGDLDGAVSSYLEAAMNSDDPAIAQRATRIALAAQSWYQAAMAADRWALLAPDDMAAREAAAATMLATNDYVGSELQLREVLDRNEDREESWGMVSSLLAQAGDPRKALDILNTLVNDYDGDGNKDTLFVRSQLLARMGEFQPAMDLANRALEQMPERVELLTFSGRLALSLDDLPLAVERFGMAFEVDPDNHDLGLAYADLLSRQARADDARAVLESMNQTPDVLLTRILFELTAQEPDRALAIYEEFDDLEGFNPDQVTYYKAQAAEAVGKPDEAIDLYSEILEGDYAPIAGIRRAELIADNGELEEARVALAQLRSLGQEAVSEQAWLSEVRLLQGEGMSEEALSVLDESLEEFPSSIALRYSRALISAETDDIVTAESDLRIVLAEEPENAAALNALGYTLADQTDRYDEAERLISRAYELSPNDASIIDSMGWVAYRLGRLEEAEGYLREAWNLDQNPEIAAHLGEVLWVMERSEEALEVWQSGLDVDSDHPVLIETIERFGAEL